MRKGTKIFLGFSFLFVFTSSGFSQSFNRDNYTQLSWISFNSASVGGSSTKYAVLCDILFGKSRTGETIYYISHSNEYGTAALAFDMNKTQIDLLAQIKSNKDYQLVFFTRTGTNNDNYHFIIDSIIPMKEAIGFAQGELPETLSYNDCYNAVDSYIKTGKVDPDHIILDKVNKAKNDTRLAEAMQASEAERQAEQQRQQEIERRETRNAARDRSRTLINATVHGGYKPCFGTENKIDLKNNKIAVFGDIDDSYSNFSISSGNNPVMRESGLQKIELVSTGDIKVLLREIRRYDGLSSDLDSKTCIFFLSKADSSQRYKLDDYILYEDIVPGAHFSNQYDAKVLDEWILQNYDK